MSELDAGLRDHLTRDLLRQLPRVLALLSKNPLSSTFGCFDRRYWQYKVADHPSGMQQELIRPLVYAWTTPFEGNRYHQSERIGQYVQGALAYHARAIHADGSLDDYFPYERALGATAYVTAALSDALLTIKQYPDSVLDSLKTSGHFLANSRETGHLSNHLAIATLALTNLHLLTGDAEWLDRSEGLIDRLAAEQHSEGWFREYQGCDLGYQTVTLEFLARRHACLPSDQLLQMLERLLAFLVQFVHPDGSLGGEYGSRNTYNFYPGGAAILAPCLPDAARLVASFWLGLETGAANCLEDDGVFSHMLSSYVTLLTATPSPDSEPASLPPEGISSFEGAGLFAGRRGSLAVYGNTTKGGVYKVFKGRQLLWSDTGFVGRLVDGTVFCQNKPGVSEGQVGPDSVTISGSCQRYKDQQLTMSKMILLRLASLLLGWLPGYSRLVRVAMQKILIYNQRSLKMRFERTITLQSAAVQVEDSLEVPDGVRVADLFLSTDCVSTHVVTSDSFQRANLLSWKRLDVRPNGERCRHTHSFSG